MSTTSPGKTGMGHRKRLRDRFLQSGLNGFLDYEIIELLLTLGTPRKDCKQMAKSMLKKFGSMLNVLNASLQELQSIEGVGPSNAFGVKLFQAISEKYLSEKIAEKKSFGDLNLIHNFLIKKIGNKDREHFILLCFDVRGNLIFDDVSVGILNASLVHPREVFKKAIACGAARVVLAHNHPSGDPTPSGADIETAKRLSEAGQILGIQILDQVIVTVNQAISIAT